MTFQVPLYFISHNGRRHKPCTKLYSELIFIVQRKRQINLTNVKMVLIDLVSTIIQLFLILFLTKVKTTFSFFIRHLLQFHPFFFSWFFFSKSDTHLIAAERKEFSVIWITCSARAIDFLMLLEIPNIYWFHKNKM